MAFRVATLNLKRNETRWRERRHLIVDEIARLKPDILTLNEASPSAGRWLQRQAQGKTNLRYALTQHSKHAAKPMTEAEAILAAPRVVGRAHRFFATPDTVFVTARLELDDRLVDVYATHLYSYRYEDSVRAQQIHELLGWIDQRAQGLPTIVCGDFNAGLDHASIQLMTEKFRPTQQAPTAFTPLRGPDGEQPTSRGTALTAASTSSGYPKIFKCLQAAYASISPPPAIRPSGRRIISVCGQT